MPAADSTFTRENIMKTLGDEILKTVRGVTTAFNKDNHNVVDADSHASAVITLAGNNTGASMKGETEDRKAAGIEGENEEEMRTFLNSNFQAVNNSIMFGGSYSSNDPGVHLEVVDYTTGHRHPEKKKTKTKTKKGENEAEGSPSLDEEKHH
ncbi:unnamed protein product [Cuscuta europaea]|uniref:Uncharacterized protein n=1 Tax=Cuscuta europaea TaxID=41803 RepID=A0A9P0ZJA0_CUSEU|nr:unnamed protein product [Cuscuta europaea]